MTQKERDNAHYYSDPDKATMSFLDFGYNPEANVDRETLISDDLKILTEKLDKALKESPLSENVRCAQLTLLGYRMALSRFNYFPNEG